MLIIKNGHVKTMVGEDILNGYVVVGDDGKIAAVGAGEPDVNGATVIDAEGRLVTPGCVEAHAHIGLHGTAVGWEGLDMNEKSDPITPQMRAIDSIYPQDEALHTAIESGVTTACAGPGSANVVCGTFAAIKLVGDRVDNMIIKYPVAMKCAFGENPKNVYGKIKNRAPVTRMGVAALLRELLFKTQRYLQDKEDGKNPAFDIKLESMIPVIKKEIPLKAHVHRADDIFTAIRIAKEFDVDLTLEHCTGADVVADELAKENYPVIIGPSFGNKTKVELELKSFKTAGILNKKGLNVCITTDAPVTPLQHLPMCAGFAVSEGMDEEDAWKAITIRPAGVCGIADRVGSLEAGKDADIIIWKDNPLRAIGAKAYYTIVDGKIVHKAE